ncbi:hypothetical protein CTAM01_03104 [Colletotrichum tamarilloi]|uniref:DUF7053 domain-containing protein n=1 Tax=Colletotrichum tamarilloi TaxID=1209934 RepID=A0ABQ9RL12_9PEZI|nr:uncharacterized protein CTAM01_03104 [Colletotrichum tamarilloi]KAK1506772.1 hypothetical protein CTAM01_03104 [Colletotrichum tamarilloi]
MSKRTTFTTISPLPPGITRDAVLDFLHNHLEMIDLNPLIKERHLIPPPPNAPPEEHACAWYSLTDEISYLPGGLATGNVSYTCCFHDLPTGLQTHCYAPMGLEIRDKWTVAGSLPGEPVEPVELGIGAPLTGLYIREDVDMRCNVFTSSFVKKTLKKSHGLLVDRLKTKVHRTVVAAAHQRHGSQNSLPGSVRSGSSGHSATQLQHQQTYPNPAYTNNNVFGNQISLPYRPSYPNNSIPVTAPTPAPTPPASDGSQTSQNAYPEPLRVRRTTNQTDSTFSHQHQHQHQQKPSWPDIKSQPSAANGYAHVNFLSGHNNAYDAKPLPPSPYAGGRVGGGGGGGGGGDVGQQQQHQRNGCQQNSGATLQGPFVAELE